MEKVTSPLLSVIVPVYNVEKYISRCIDSILSQTFTDFELILVDDGSPDRCGEICDEYAKKDDRIIVIHQENKGVSAARNRGLDIAQGEYITFIDPDDSIVFDTFELNINILENNFEIDFVQFPIKVIGKKAKYWDGSFCKEIKGRDEILFYWYNNKNITYSVWGKIFKKKVFSSLRFPNKYIYAEDLYLIPDILSHINIVYLSDSGCYKHFCHKDSATSEGVSDRHLIKYMNLYSSYIKLLRFVFSSSDNVHIQIFILKVIITHFLQSEKEEKINMEKDIQMYIPKLRQIHWKLSVKDNIWIIALNVFKVSTFINFYNKARNFYGVIKGRNWKSTILEILYLLFNKFPLIVKGKIEKNLIYVHWGRGLHNFGDCLQPDILRYYGLTPVYVSDINRSDVVLAGSILQWISPKYSGYIIGTGGDSMKYFFPNAKILAVRGKLTLSNIQGDTSHIKMGDPGLLMSYVYPQACKVKYRLGIIPHFVDKDGDIIKKWKETFGPNVLFIDVLKSPRRVINEIKQCAAIVSSSLHGLIIADAFHIPNVRFVDRKTMPTSFYDYKFDDYYSSIDCESRVMEVDGSETVEKLQSFTTVKPITKIKFLQENLNEIMIDFAKNIRLK